MREIIDIMAQYEETIGKLYQTYAQTQPELADLWNTLYSQEMEHRNWLINLADAVGTGKVHFNKGRFKIEPLHLALDYINKELSKAQNMTIPTKDSLNKAFQIEQSMIEKKFFEVFETDSVDLKHVLQNLANETKKHIEMIREKQASLA